ncbi:MAG: hypothetical protein N3D82_04480 [Ignisphaera sp.]|nr:hypothetical protein [Ignisphaera sp.]MCX8168265.1 hypothetical protein [Ignisphaera sp.]MDW8084867.1 hypothetical protein [Ignisphaera sp.]
MNLPTPKTAPSKPLELSVAAVIMLSVLAIPIHIAKIDFPLAPFLKFDLCGIPLAVAGFVNLPFSVTLGLPVFYLGILLTGATNPLSPLMKVFAEASTYIPMVYMYRYLHKRNLHTSIRTASLLIIATAVASRSVVMFVLNILITPLIATLFWGAPSYTIALQRIIIPVLHLITLFNAISAVYVSALSLPAVRILEKMGFITRPTTT